MQKPSTKILVPVLFLALFLVSFTAFGQMSSMSDPETQKFNTIFGLIELPFLLIAVIFSFMTSKRLKGGRFGAGMRLLAYGFLVMAIGHLHMQVEAMFGFNLFNELLGATAGRAAWFIALIVTWGLSSLGFLKIYRASQL